MQFSGQSWSRLMIYYRMFRFPFFLSVLMLLLLFSERWSPFRNDLSGESERPAGFDLRRDRIQVRMIAEQKPRLHCIAGLPLRLSLRVSNFSPYPIVSGQNPQDGPEKKVNLSYRFYDSSDHTLLKEGDRYLFSPAIPAAAGENEATHRDVTLLVSCPEAEDVIHLSVQVVQEGLAWQEDVRTAEDYVHDIPVKVSALGKAALSPFPFRYLKAPDPEQFSALPSDQKMKATLLTAYRMALILLDASLIRVPLADKRWSFVSDAGSQYPMVWSRDMAGIQQALTLAGLRTPEAGHWSELFFAVQDQYGGQIPDWVVAGREITDEATSDKNDVQSDQELWLLDSVLASIRMGSLPSGWVHMHSSGRPHGERMRQLLSWLLDERFSEARGCLANSHTVDWGDVALLGADSQESTHREHNPSRVCGLFLQALLIRVAEAWQATPALVSDFPVLSDRLAHSADAARKFVNDQLWMPERGYFRMHVHLDHPEKELPDEDGMFALGGHVMAYEAGLLKREQLQKIAATILARQRAFRVSTIGAVLLPPFPDGTFGNPIMKAFQYQNGGQWDWFGARAAGLLEQVDRDKGVRGLFQIAEKVVRNGSFYEWDHPDGSPGAGIHFRAGAAAYISSFHGIFSSGMSQSCSESGRLICSRSLPPENAEACGECG
ncbi:MAG: hypothetical protein H6618_01185 [Deltaproteobacteria bacterium]|nr:hypothetical protein [Deltaproteobacteria bacterium]